ncbi:MAG: ORC1-type DNA replication protein [Candidatus Thorarchaeota archaeon]|nr:ORC1-type DNA replication protein [Candidatus Thorarchaeota archaeon]
MTDKFIDFVEDELSRDSVFKREQVLSIDYVPESLPHREDEQRVLARSFKTLIKSPGSTSPRLIIEGPVGTGKTAVTKRFADQLVKVAQRRGIRLHSLHINCRVNKSIYLVYLRMLREFKPSFPRRGHSPHEILQILVEVLDAEDRYLLLILDELDYFIRHAGPDILYDLTRLMDDRLNAPQRLAVIGVGRDIPLATMLDRSTLSTLQQNILHFSKYSSSQLYDILKERVDQAFVESAVMNETIQLICDIAAERGDARYAIELLWRAGKQADREGASVVIPDYVRQAKADTHPELRKEVFATLPLHNRLLLLAAARLLKESRDAYVMTGTIEDMYHSICEEYGEEPRSHTQVWEWVQDLAAHGLIDAKRSGVGLRGQTTLVGLSDVPAEMLERFLQQLIESKSGVV